MHWNCQSSIQLNLNFYFIQRSRNQQWTAHVWMDTFRTKEAVIDSTIVSMECSTWSPVQVGSFSTTAQVMQTKLLVKCRADIFFFQKIVLDNDLLCIFLSIGICTWPDEAQKKGCSSEGKLISLMEIWLWI